MWHLQARARERFPFGWNHPLDEKTLKIKDVEHVLDRKSRSTFPEHALAQAAHLIRQFAKSGGDAVTGIAAIEFAIIVPLLILMLVGVIDLGLGMYRNMQVQESAQAGAQYAVVKGCTASDISNAVTSATSYSSIAASPGPVEFCGCATATGLTNITNQNTTCSSACSGSTCSNGYTAGTYVTVSASATYYPSLIYSSLFPKSFALTAQSTVRIK